MALVRRRFLDISRHRPLQPSFEPAVFRNREERRSACTANPQIGEMPEGIEHAHSDRRAQRSAAAEYS